MPLRRLARGARHAWEVPRDLLLGRYPEFVTGGGLPRGHVPVFVFHGLEADSFAAKLRHLADNGYQTLSTDEYFQVLKGAKPAPERAVLLTFDDGRASVWGVGLPLMRRYGFKGTVFIVPGRVKPGPGPVRPSLENARSAASVDRDPGDDPFLSWDEIGDLLRSELFDFQSHTLLHARIHSGPHVAGFLTPAHLRGCAALDVPLLRGDDRDLVAHEIPLGTPLLRSEPRTSESLRFFEDPSVRVDCVRRVEEEGGEGFFYKRGWERELRSLLGRRPLEGRFETREERLAAIRRELFDSKRLIEERTGRPVIHLCYPWHVAGPTARALAVEVGYETAFCGKVPGTPITLPGGDPHQVARIGEDYVELLPGRGRTDLAQILRRKWSRRLRRKA